MSLQLNSMCRYHGIEQIAGIWIPLTLCSSPAPQSSAISENSTTLTRHKNSPDYPRHLSPQRAREILQLILTIRILLLIPGNSVLSALAKILQLTLTIRILSPAPQSSASSENSTTHTHHNNSPVFFRTSILGEPVKLYNSWSPVNSWDSATRTHHKNCPVYPRHLNAPASSENLQLLQLEFPVDPRHLSPPPSSGNSTTHSRLKNFPVGPGTLNPPARSENLQLLTVRILLLISGTSGVREILQLILAIRILLFIPGPSTPPPPPSELGKIYNSFSP
jgi:hypothetical protein